MNDENPKDPLEMTAEERKKIEIRFAPGCFDNFEGTQEELDKLMSDIQGMIESGELFEKARSVDIDDMDEEELAKLASAMLSEEELEELFKEGMPDVRGRRNLQ